MSLIEVLKDITRLGAGQMPTEQESIDEHHENEEYWEQRQAARDTWVDGYLPEATKRQDLINAYIADNADDYEEFVRKCLEVEWDER